MNKFELIQQENKLSLNIKSCLMINSSSAYWWYVEFICSKKIVKLWRGKSF